MSSMDAGTTHFVRCLKCNKILKCTIYDTAVLLEHIRTDHPEIEIVESFTQTQSQGTSACCPHKQESTDGCTCHTSSMEKVSVCPPSKNDVKIVYSRHYSINNKPLSENRLKLYRSSIEKWRPSTGRIFCPKCGRKGRPIFRTEDTSGNTCCAACILSCWPFCFIPFLCPDNRREYLHCCNCKMFLGLYDRANNCIRPNREYMDIPDELESKPTDTSLVKSESDKQDSTEYMQSRKNFYSEKQMRSKSMIESKSNMKSRNTKDSIELMRSKATEDTPEHVRKKNSLESAKNLSGEGAIASAETNMSKNEEDFQENEKSKSGVRSSDYTNKKKSREKRNSKVDRSTSQEKKDSKISRSTSQVKKDSKIDRSTSQVKKDSKIDRSTSQEKKGSKIDRSTIDRSKN